MVLFYSAPKKTALTPQTIKLSIHALDGFGQGIAHYQGKTIFIKNALPTEEVEVRLTEDKKQYAKAKVIKYWSKSLLRAVPPCRHYTTCGGCAMQHMPVSMQHQAKVQAFRALMNKETGYALATGDIKIVSSQPYHYRRRARLAVQFENNRLVVGFRQVESKQVVDIDVCPVLVNELEQILIPLKASLNELSDKKALGHVELISVDSGVIVIIRHIRPLAVDDQQRLTRFAQQQAISLYLHGKELVQITGSSDHYYHIKSLTLSFSPLDFIQINEYVNIKMVEQALNWLALTPADRVLDLFCGMGNFTLPVAMQAANVIGIEGVAALVDKARANATLNQSHLIGNVAFSVSNLDNIDSQSDWFLANVNKVLLDPARAGAYEVMARLAQYSPSHIVYISCNPATLVRDSKQLLKAGYQIAKVAILDMFPQTKHIESMLLFIKLGTKKDGINKRSPSAK